MSKKIEEVHRDIYDGIKPSDELLNKTRMKMKEELEKQKLSEATGENKRVNRGFRMRPMLAMACVALMVVGINGIDQIKPKIGGVRPKIDNKVDPNPKTDIPNKKVDLDYNEKVPGGDKKPIGKIAINIYGKIDEVQTGDVTRIRIKDTWIVIDEKTEFHSLFEGVENSKDFKVGNTVQGFTQDNIEEDEVRALYIYMNEKSRE